MGQKVHPYGFRLGYTKGWRSRWYAGAGYADLVAEDLKLKANLRNKPRSAGISSIEIDRPGNKLRITIKTARPGIIIGRRGSEIEKLKLDLQNRTKREVYIDIQEVHRPELDAQLVSESVAMQIEKRVAFRRAMRKAVDSALRFGCKGIKIMVAGRLNGQEIARAEWHLQGRLPLQTLRADIEYGFTEAHTTYGVIGVKCWVYKGDMIDNQSRRDDPEPARRREARNAATDRARAASNLPAPRRQRRGLRSRRRRSSAAPPVAPVPRQPAAQRRLPPQRPVRPLERPAEAAAPTAGAPGTEGGE